jgi:hypothetical protein
VKFAIKRPHPSSWSIIEIGDELGYAEIVWMGRIKISLFQEAVAAK